MLAPLCLALAAGLAVPPRVAVVVVGKDEALRDSVHAAVAGDPTVQVQLQAKAFVDELLKGAADAGLHCTVDDAVCWTKVGLDGELDEIFVAQRTSVGVEVRVVDVNQGREVRRAAGADAKSALESLRDPAPAARTPTPEPSPQPQQQTTTTTATSPTTTPPAAAPSPTSDGAPLMLIAAGGLGVLGAGCGVIAAVIDVGLTDSLTNAQLGAPLDVDAYRSQENTQNVLIGCGVVAGVAAAATAVVAVMTDET